MEFPNIWRPFEELSLQLVIPIIFQTCHWHYMAAGHSPSLSRMQGGSLFGFLHSPELRLLSKALLPRLMVPHCDQGHWCLACTSSPWRPARLERMRIPPATHQSTYPLTSHLPTKPPIHPIPTCLVPCQAWLCAKWRHRCRSMTSVSNSLARCSIASSQTTGMLQS